MAARAQRIICATALWFWRGKMLIYSTVEFYGTSSGGIKVYNVTLRISDGVTIQFQAIEENLKALGLAIQGV